MFRKARSFSRRSVTIRIADLLLVVGGVIWPPSKIASRLCSGLVPSQWQTALSVAIVRLPQIDIAAKSEGISRPRLASYSHHKVAGKDQYSDGARRASILAR